MVRGGNLKTNSPLARTLWAAILVAAALLVSSACQKRGAGPDVMARVNGRDISRAEVQKYFDNQTAGAPQTPSGEQAESLRLSILRQLVDDEILMQRAEKLGLLATDEEVNRRLNEIKAPYTQEEFTKRLQDKKITLDDFKRDLRRSLTVDKVLNREITSKINITDQDITSYYNAHKAEFNLIEPQYHLAHILVTGTPNPQVHNLKNDKARNDAEARKKIQMLVNRLDSGEDFATLAMNYSEDPETAGNGGDLGFTPESSLKGTDPATREAITKLKPGQYSAIIQVVNPTTHQLFGYRIIKLIAKEPAGQRDLNDPRVQQAIREQLRDRREQLLKAAFYEEIRDQARVENFYAEQILSQSGK